MHAATHPGARLRPRRDEPTATDSGTPASSPSAEELLDALAAEDDESDA